MFRSCQLLCAMALGLTPLPAFAQSVDGTPAGHRLNVSVSHYRYVEPGPTISISGAKIGGEYVGTIQLNQHRRWFAQADVIGNGGSAAYEGFCSPWLIRPNSSSQNGYELGFGQQSACSESGSIDWYVDGRGLIGKDFLRQRWAFSPYSGLAVRYLSNGVTGNAGFRTDKYLYVPLGVTAHTAVASHRVSVSLEYDHLIRGWQTTRNSKLGGGEIPATPTAPAFVIDGITDVSFVQHGGWAARVSAKYDLTNRWSVEPYYVRWSVDSSPVNFETATFTVSRVSARQQLGFYEPFNTTNEFGIKLGMRL
jgi:hypothetical protein